MSELVWSRTNGASGPSVSIVFSDGDVKTIGNENASLDEIVRLLATGGDEEKIRELVNPAKGIATRFRSLSDRVTTDGVNIFFDGDAIHDTLSDYILKLIRLENSGEEAPSWKPFVNFLEKLAQNQLEDSRQSLYDFIERFGLTIRPNGDFIAYKGLRPDFSSVRSGPGIVNSVEHNGHLPNKPGSILEVKRSYVDANRANGCSTGLHAGTHRYASHWGEVVVAVAINPRDVISVPQDGAFEKLRVCRYEVLNEAPRTSAPKATAGAESAPIWNAPAPEKAPDGKLVKKLEKAAKSGDAVKVTYRGKSYRVIVRRLEDKLLKVRLANKPKDYRQFTLNKIESVKPLETKSTKKAKGKKVAKDQAQGIAEVTKLLGVAILTATTVKLTLANGDKLVVKPRRLVDGFLAATIPSKQNRFEKLELKKIARVKTA